MYETEWNIFFRFSGLNIFLSVSYMKKSLRDSFFGFLFFHLFSQFENNLEDFFPHFRKKTFSLISFCRYFFLQEKTKNLRNFPFMCFHRLKKKKEKIRLENVFSPFNTSVVLYFYSSAIFPWISLWGYKHFICCWIFIDAWTEQKRESILCCAEADISSLQMNQTRQTFWTSLEYFLAFLTLKDNSDERQSVVCWEGCVGVLYWPGSWAGCRNWGGRRNSMSAVINSTWTSWKYFKTKVLHFCYVPVFYWSDLKVQYDWMWHLLKSFCLQIYVINHQSSCFDCSYC